jgi:galactoside O-acetyltransferase
MIEYIQGLRDLVARRSLLRQAGVSVAGNARVHFRKIRFSPGSVLQIGSGAIIEGILAFEREGARITVGRDTFVGGSILSAAEEIVIGDDVLISWGCGIVDHNSHSLSWEHRKHDVRDWRYGRKDWTHVSRRPVHIADKAWIGFNTAILKGVQVGEGAIIGAGSVVTKDVPPFTIAAGNPARVIRALSREEITSQASRLAP